MKSLLLLVISFAALTPAMSQERLPRAEALKYACYLCLDLKQMLDTPIPTDPDVKRPVAIRGGNRGGLLLPEAKLSAEVFTKATGSVLPLAQLWLVNVAPMKEGQVVSADKLKKVEVKAESNEATAYCCALGVQKNSAGAFELLVYGKGKEPLVHTALKSFSGSTDSEAPCDMTAEVQDNGALVTLKILGKYQASFMLGEAEP